MNIIRTEQDGVEFFTIVDTGESGMSYSGIAALCGKNQSTITRLVQKLQLLQTRLQSGDPKKDLMRDLDSKRLEPLIDKSLHLMRVYQKRGGEVKILKSDVCAILIKHYAFEGSEVAEYAMDKFQSMGIEAWIQGITGWQANQSPPPPEQPQGIFPELKLNLPPLKTFEDACVFFFTAGEWLANAKATVSAYRLFFTVIENEAYGDRPNADELITEAKISKSSFYKSLKILKQAKLLPEWARSDTRDFLEFRIRDRLKVELNGEIEVNTEVGLIDLLTPKEVIEIKAIQHWKTALGHVIAKGQVYPTHGKRIHLFGMSDLAIAKIRTYCSPLNVSVTFEKVTAEQIAV